MTIPASEFRRVGEALNPGKRTRIDHTCGEGRTLIVSRDQNGISAYCFRCHKKGYIHTERSLAERIAALSEANEWDGAAQESLEMTITEGTGRPAFKDMPFKVAGKTGTAHVQMVIPSIHIMYTRDLS